MQELVFARATKSFIDSAFDTWLLYTCREQRLREIEANNLVSTYMSEREAEWESENWRLHAAVEDLHKEVYTLHDEFTAAQLKTVERAKQLVLREQMQAQERLDDSAMELERLRAEFLSSSQPATPGAGKAKPRRHMAFF